MSKTIVFPTATIKDKTDIMYEGIVELIQQLNDDNNKVIIMSHDRSRVADLESEIGSVEICYRWQVRDMMKEDNEGNYILVGSNEDDMRMAASTKTVLLTPKWSDVKDPGPIKYGLGIPTPKTLYKVIQIIKNQKVWFYHLDLNDRSTVYSLTSANSRGDISKSEREIVDGFRDSLKKGNRKYFKVLQLHFLASLIHNPMFKEVDIWSVMPSSSTDINEDLWALKERARILMGKRLVNPLFIRHTEIKKSHHYTNITDRLYCDRHFQSIKINPEYRNKIKGKVICVLDDYLTNGTSFESIRTLLIKAGAKKIILVSLGRFRRGSGIEYYKQDYNIAGDVFTQNYSYELIEEIDISGEYNPQARNEIENLYSLIYSNDNS
ncbi:phosphoribosyltransferase [Halalkalibacter akibai]|uniref:Phosphoribosyltransferase domain-containing protein n=1 Tax=Halalkalibacter akibai (strain ATCC 43226 / DSM 21942 / CIP 109018 / JCM 9157 / 1139) TaxID=1236973 RepID=W4QXV0_HALA3|nr:phosphoribosyltransferase [Halalkalibacter akibai]GAE36468.1 hypothetical protein JCM9157_3657 [Halalkalibacter akibai JCM 9157]